VFYDSAEAGARVLGGGFIAKALPAADAPVLSAAAG
jgi:hypothetical protein